MANTLWFVGILGLVVGCAAETTTQASDEEGTGGVEAGGAAATATAAGGASTAAPTGGKASGGATVAAGGYAAPGGAPAAAGTATVGPDDLVVRACLLVMQNGCQRCAKCWELSSGIAECAMGCADTLQCFAVNHCTPDTCGTSTCLANSDSRTAATETFRCSCGT